MIRKRLTAFSIAAALTLGSLAGFVPAQRNSQASLAAEKNTVLTVDMAKRTGPLKHGASGFLYGLGSDQVPSTSLLIGLKPDTTVQKPPNGLQHPGGDVLEMADTFLQAGGKSIQVYCPDIHANWPYEDESKDMKAYEQKIRKMVREIKEKGIQEHVVYIPFNEPDGQQYKSIEKGDSKQFLADWKYLYDVIKDEDPTAKIAGSNCCVYREPHTEDFVKFCAENNCIPDQFTWHALFHSELQNLKTNLKKYRELEKTYWLEPGLADGEREVIINEYADFTDLGVPGRLIPYIGILEDAKVSGCLAYWHVSNNLDDLAADNNQPNGAWWLYKWYGDMSGETLQTSVSGAKNTEFYGVASLDDAKKSAHVIFGGTSGTQTVKLRGLGQTSVSTSGKVRVTLERTNWTGINGASDQPEFLYKKICEPEADGTLSIQLEDAIAAAGYHLTISQAPENAKTGTSREGAWNTFYEGEDGVFGGEAVKDGKNRNYACSGTGVARFKSQGDTASYTIDVPEDGFYKFDMVYGAATGNKPNKTELNNPVNSEAFFYVDGLEKRKMILPNTLTWYMSGMHTEYQYLRKGEHEITIMSGNTEGLLTLDCMYLTFVGAEGIDVNERKYVKTYEAELSDFNILGGQTATNVKTETERDGYSGSGYVSGFDTPVTDGGGIRLGTCVNDNGIYEIKVRYAAEQEGSIGCYLDNTARKLDNKASDLPTVNTENGWKQTAICLYLQKGMNILDFDASDAKTAMDTITVSKKENGTLTTPIEAEDCTFSGEVQIKENPYTSGGKYVAGIQGDSEKANCLTVSYHAEQAGTYQMAVYQSNQELFGNHSYNAQMVDRYVTMQVNDGEPFPVYFRNTYSDESFQSKVISLTLAEGDNTIQIYNDDTRALKNGIGGVNSCTNYTPNLDKFEITPLLAASESLRAPAIPEKDLATPLPKPTAAPPAETPKASETPQAPQSVPSVQPSASAPAQTMAPPLKKGDRIAGKNLTYTVTNAGRKEICVTNAEKKPAVTIPSTITSHGVTYRVTSIGKKTFAGNKKLKKISIGKYVTKIESRAFYRARSLKHIVIKGTGITSVGKNAFTGIHKKAVLRTSKKKKAFYRKLFAKGGFK